MATHKLYCNLCHGTSKDVACSCTIEKLQASLAHDTITDFTAGLIQHIASLSLGTVSRHAMTNLRWTSDFTSTHAPTISDKRAATLLASASAAERALLVSDARVQQGYDACRLRLAGKLPADSSATSFASVLSSIATGLAGLTFRGLGVAVSYGSAGFSALVETAGVGLGVLHSGDMVRTNDDLPPDECWWVIPVWDDWAREVLAHLPAHVGAHGHALLVYHPTTPTPSAPGCGGVIDSEAISFPQFVAGLGPVCRTRFLQPPSPSPARSVPALNSTGQALIRWLAYRGAAVVVDAREEGWGDIVVLTPGDATALMQSQSKERIGLTSPHSRILSPEQLTVAVSPMLLNSQLTKLEASASVCRARITEHVSRARGYLQEGNRQAAKGCLKRKAMEAGRLAGLEEQMVSVTAMVHALQQARENGEQAKLVHAASCALRSLSAHPSLSLSAIEDDLDDMAELMDRNREVGEAMGMQGREGEQEDIERELDAMFAQAGAGNKSSAPIAPVPQSADEAKSHPAQAQARAQSTAAPPASNRVAIPG